MTFYIYLKSLHIIFVVCWFAGLFYIVRLFIYQTESLQKSELEKEILVSQFQLMQKRLWYVITWPSFIFATLFGVWMILKNPSILSNSWIYLKFGLLCILIFYHLMCHIIYLKLRRGDYLFSSLHLRVINEIPTILLFMIVFISFLKNINSFRQIVYIFVVLALIIAFGIWMYKKWRKTLK